VDLPYSTFLVPLRDEFHSVVTRDVVPDPDWRGFAVHFRPGLDREAKLQRARAVLGVAVGDMEAVTEARATLPSPVLGHRDVVAALDRALARERVALTGNWFTGLSIEDCVLRSRAEWARVSAR
jgi:UDP-galactopyranose mutase